MTFSSPSQALHQYQILLTQLQEAVGKETMAQQTLGVQSFFKQDVWPLINQAELSGQQHSAVTEIHRHMRLLTLDVSFAQAARQGATRQQRLQNIEQRLVQLQGFIQILLTLLEPSEN